ncbi:hypothetical protein BGZ51_003819 [Haplosporangium sp. Z 767]|nr:hypothetical protein BGZ51_003819 [Haplosporangium sp. Z 767]KAF9192719.1 hypothetical protein BGZ50_008276 [Haplosporangium sp. Z 11]
MVAPGLTELKFRQKLTGNAAELLKKLKELHAELKTLEQDTVDRDSLTSLTKPLIDASIVNHKDKGVRIYAACCIADILRLTAPDAPYTKSQLKIVFSLFVNELRHIVNPSGPYFSMYYYLLESLSAVKSIVLITELKNADGIMVELFRNTFDDVRPQQAKNVQICMSELLQHIIDEAENLPQEIVDIILAQFLHKHKFDNPAAYRLACDLGNNCADKLQRYVFQYFSDIISTAGNGELSHKELEDFKTVHQLVIELNKATPALLLNVIPQLEEELKLSDVAIRTLATESLGEMFAEKTSQLATQYESTWRAWLQRRNDKVPQVRIVWVESLVNLIKAHGALAKELNEGLAEKLVDPDEKVRATVCRIIGEFDYETSLHHLQKNTLIQVGHRCRDKKKSVSKEAIKTLSVLYNQAYPEIENGTKTAVSQFGWMPSAILHAVYVNDNEIFARFYMTAFLQILKAQEASPMANGEAEELDRKLGAVIKVLCERLPEPVKCSLLLYKYGKIHDEKFVKSISDCMDSRLSLKEIRKAARISLTPINSEVLSELIKNIGESDEQRQVSGELLRSISLIYPAIFKDHLGEITSLLRGPESTGAADSLHTLAEFAKQFPRSVPADARAKETLESFLESGMVRQVIHATIVLSNIPDNAQACTDIAESVVGRLAVTSTRLLKDLAILSQLALYSPQAFESVSSSAVSFIIKKLLMTNIPEQETMYESTEDWVEKQDLDEYSLSKVMGLKVLVNRAIVLLESDVISAQDAVRPVFKLLWTLLSQEGEVVAEKNTKPTYEKMVSVTDYSRLALVIQDPVYRVRHGLASRIMKYLRSKELHIRYLAVLILAAHEPEDEWRLQIRNFLIHQSKSQENAESNLMLNELTLARVMHLLANHPDFVLKTSPDNVFSDAQETHTVEDLNLAARYIEFYLETMANSENVSLIFYIASLLKTVRFANVNEHTQNLYVLSDLAQYLIQEKSRSHNWTLTSYPGQVKLPRELFAPFGQSDLAVEISKKSYLSSEWVRAREHKTERKPRVQIERKMGQAVKRRSRSPSSAEGDGVEDGGEGDEGVSSFARAKRSKKIKSVEHVPEEPTRRMASRAAKAKATVYKDVDTSEEEEEEGSDAMANDQENSP